MRITRLGIEAKYDPTWLWPWVRVSLPIYSYNFDCDFENLLEYWEFCHHYEYSEEDTLPLFMPTRKQRFLSFIAR